MELVMNDYSESHRVKFDQIRNIDFKKSKMNISIMIR